MSYEALLARLLPARRFGVVLGLERMRGLLDRLGAPDAELGAIVHVAGTNGKGSTVAMIAALARAAGRRVGAYTSPHLSTLRERATVDGELLDEAAWVSAGEAVRAAGGDEHTFFEQVTAIAMLALARARVELTVLEVGLGGRLDATNVVAPRACVVTGVAMDHEAILGDTLEKIAAEKAGIFKPGVPAIVGASGEARAVPVLIEAARASGASPVIVVDEAADVPRVALPGAHQRRNAVAAIAAVRALGLPLVESALATVVHPGRFEVIGDVILDGAHNPHGAFALAEVLRARGERPVLVVAASADKDVRGIAAALAPVVSHVIATRYRQDRAMDPEALAAVFGGCASHAPDLASALARARTLGAPILVAGSLFLVGEARTLLLGAPTDPFVVTDPPAR